MNTDFTDVFYALLKRKPIL